MTKLEKIEMINAALGRSSLAQTKQAKAIILDDGRIEYQMVSSNGRYTVKATFREILNLMHGADMRAIKAAV